MWVCQNIFNCFLFLANKWSLDADDANQKPSIQKKSHRRGKISYKHEIKKSGKTILKYNSFRRLRPHQEDFYGKSKYLRKSEVYIWDKITISKVQLVYSCLVAGCSDFFPAGIFLEETFAGNPF